MKGLLILLFGVGAFWDGLTTMFGVVAMLGANDFRAYLFGIVTGLVILGFGFGTKTIFSEASFPYPIFQVLWIIGILFDMYTSFVGTASYLILHKFGPDAGLFASMSAGQWAFVAGLTVIICSAPMIISFWIDEEVRTKNISCY
jgi:hypothetical protein